MVSAETYTDLELFCITQLELRSLELNKDRQIIPWISVSFSLYNYCYRVSMFCSLPSNCNEIINVFAKNDNHGRNISQAIKGVGTSVEGFPFKEEFRLKLKGHLKEQTNIYLTAPFLK